VNDAELFEAYKKLSKEKSDAVKEVDDLKSQKKQDHSSRSYQLQVVALEQHISDLNQELLSLKSEYQSYKVRFPLLAACYLTLQSQGRAASALRTAQQSSNKSQVSELESDLTRKEEQIIELTQLVEQLTSEKASLSSSHSKGMTCFCLKKKKKL
jgi:exonuclease VII small subunit